ncbi:ATP synthase subunit beta [Artemisia annua]|uniref:H(+)-transporting two-sector ATPase n=1 Tax=Artemisia annua TaxID=35608 RepID=A0A2U1LZN5_ARTAN|nr:ATP synthase subunit beta [Artemisia annua]
MSERRSGVVSCSGCCLIISAAIERNNADLALSIFNAMRSSFGGFSVFAGVGELTSEANGLYREMMESVVIKLGDKQSESKCALVYS